MSGGFWENCPAVELNAEGFEVFAGTQVEVGALRPYIASRAWVEDYLTNFEVDRSQLTPVVDWLLDLLRDNTNRHARRDYRTLLAWRAALDCPAADAAAPTPEDP